MGKVKRALKQAAKVEHEATRRLADLRDAPAMKLAGGASEVADQPPLVALSVATVVLGAVLRRRTVMRSGARMLAAHALSTGVKTVIKHAIDRTRPVEAIDGDDGHHVGKGTGATRTELNSFPSGHTAGAVAVARAASRELPGAALPAGLAAGAVAAIQLPRGKHYLTDVAVGGAIGWVSEAVVDAAFRRVDWALLRRARP